MRAPPFLACTALHAQQDQCTSVHCHFTHTCHAVQVQLPEQFKHVVCEAMEAAAIPVPKTEERWEQAAHALKVRSEHAGLIGTLTVLSKQIAAPTVTVPPSVWD